MIDFFQLPALFTLGIYTFGLITYPHGLANGSLFKRYGLPFIVLFVMNMCYAGFVGILSAPEKQFMHTFWTLFVINAIIACAMAFGFCIDLWNRKKRPRK